MPHHQAISREIAPAVEPPSAGELRDAGREPESGEPERAVAAGLDHAGLVSRGRALGLQRSPRALGEVERSRDGRRAPLPLLLLKERALARRERARTVGR
ncbi:MAG: hypothetical protein AAFZ87_11830, partial [Planctomycetota bacterium]